MRVLILAVLLSVAPAPAAVAQGADSAEAPQVPQSVWRIGENGSAEHLQSGLRCPASLAGLARDSTTAIDGLGLDVACGYSRGDASVTIYITRQGQPEQAYEFAKSAILQRFGPQGVELASEDAPQSGGMPWRRAEFRLPADFRTEVWLTDIHGWNLKYRATYPRAEAGRVQEALGAFSGVARSSAGMKLDLCAKSQTPARRGKLMKTRGRNSEFGLMAAILGGAAAVAAEEAGEAAQPLTYCLEEVVSGDDVAFLLWRAVMPDGSDAQADRLTPMTMGAPPALDVAIDGLGNLIRGELAGRGAKTSWIATSTAGAQTSIYGHFDGRPSAKVMSQLMQRMIDGKAGPIGGYSADGKNITVSVP